MGKAIHTGLVQEECMTGVCDLFNPIWVYADYPPKYGEGTYIDTGIHIGTNALVDSTQTMTINTATTKLINIVPTLRKGSLCLSFQAPGKSLSVKTSEGVTATAYSGNIGGIYFACTPDKSHNAEFITTGLSANIGIVRFIPAQEAPVKVEVMESGCTIKDIEMQYGSGEHIYEFDAQYEVEGGTASSFSVKITYTLNNDSKFSYSLKNKDTGQVYYEYNSMASTNKTTSVPPGTYQVILKPYPGTAEKGSYTNMDIAISVTPNITWSTDGMVSSADDTYQTATIIDINKTNTVRNWVGNTASIGRDDIDYWEITNFDNRSYTITVRRIQGSGNLKNYLWERNGDTFTLIAEWYASDSTAGITHTLSSGKRYYIKVTPTGTNQMYTIKVE